MDSQSRAPDVRMLLSILGAATVLSEPRSRELVHLLLPNHAFAFEADVSPKDNDATATVVDGPIDPLFAELVHPQHLSTIAKHFLDQPVANTNGMAVRSGTRWVPASSVAQLDHESYILRLQHLPRGQDVVFDAFEDIVARAGITVSFHVYSAAPGETILNRHTDPSDVLVIALEGSKDWEVCSPSMPGDNSLTIAQAGDQYHTVRCAPTANKGLRPSYHARRFPGQRVPLCGNDRRRGGSDALQDPPPPPRRGAVSPARRRPSSNSRGSPPRCARNHWLPPSHVEVCRGGDYQGRGDGRV